MLKIISQINAKKLGTANMHNYITNRTYFVYT